MSTVLTLLLAPAELAVVQGLLRREAPGEPRRQRFDELYFDTPEQQLRELGLSRGGHRWAQRLEGGGGPGSHRSTETGPSRPI
ncbi:MAG TPA: hypothetical protein VJN44_04240 [Roseateles sp.]|nr:hypothetical protein [Roseateles sp.]